MGESLSWELQFDFPSSLSRSIFTASFDISSTGWLIRVMEGVM